MKFGMVRYTMLTAPSTFVIYLIHIPKHFYYSRFHLNEVQVFLIMQGIENKEQGECTSSTCKVLYYLTAANPNFCNISNLLIINLKYLSIFLVILLLNSLNSLHHIHQY